MHYKKTNGEKIKVFGIPTADVYIKGKQKPIDKLKSPQYIKNNKDIPIQYID
ncbi:hypothetical protein ACWEWW_01985 [Staphylococcus xylosus]